MTAATACDSSITSPSGESDDAGDPLSPKRSGAATNSDEPPPGAAMRDDRAAPASEIQVDIAHTDDNVRKLIDANWIDLLGRAVEACGHDVARLAVRVVDDQEISRLHQQFMQIEGPTDVLTFQQNADGEAADADVAICADEAIRQASARDGNAAHELLLYAIHGLLHCIGYDDHTQVDAERMHAREDEILRTIEIGNVYAAEQDQRGDKGGDA